MMEITREWARKSLMGHANSHESICEKLREIYDLVHELPAGDFKENITEKLVDAVIMGKKMQDRLFYWKDHYLGDVSGNDGKNLEVIEDYEERKTKRASRTLSLITFGT